MSGKQKCRYIAGDIGGTNSRLQLIEIQDTSKISSHYNRANEKLIGEKIYSSQNYKTLTEIIGLFIKEFNTTGPHPTTMCLAVAGPVQGNRSHITNVHWIIDGDELKNSLQIHSVMLINDFVGIGYGILALHGDDIIVLNDKESVPEAPKAVIGAGTGLGEAYLTYNSHTYDVWGCEGGHTDYAPRNALEYDLLEYIKKTLNITRVSVERVVSGTGIPYIYDFLLSRNPEKESVEVRERMKSENRSKIISIYARENKCSLCVETMDLFIQMYGAETGNLALKILPLGGIYIAGGVAAKNVWAMKKNNQFVNEYIRKGRMSGLLEKIPIYLVTNESVGLLGASVVCSRLMDKHGHIEQLSTAEKVGSMYSEKWPHTYPVAKL